MARIAANKPSIKLVTPVFNEIENLPRYEQAIKEKLLSCTEVDFQVLFVDDGSRDGSWEAIKRICARDERFHGMRLSRNFGSHAALCAGLRHVDGDAVAIIACDLQDPPEVILEFVQHWQQGAQIVWGKRRSRIDSWWRIKASQFFEGIMRRYAMPPESQFTTGSFLFMDRKVLKSFQQFNETHRITFALVAWSGFEQKVVEYDRQARLAGQSKWGLQTLISTAYGAFLSYSRVPFGFISAVGAGLFVFSVVLGIYLVFNYLMGDPKPGWVSIMLALCIFFGLHFVFMSVQGEYLARIYTEAVGRPLYFISDTTPNLEKQSRDAA